MTTPQSGIYFGTVSHRRLQPLRHELKYDVASLLVDVDDLAAHNLPLLLSHNRFNLFSIYDKDHGEKSNGNSIANFAWEKVEHAGLSQKVSRILMLCYPRILGFAFNPLTTYFALDGDGEVRLMIYEVHNTFGGRHTYVSDPIALGQANYHVTEKRFRVSPFNAVEGHYGLRATPPLDKITVGVALSTSAGPILKAHFQGTRKELNNRNLLGYFCKYPFFAAKVVGGIHWEALKLWLKGLNLAKP
jgi:uncharacterized protein